MVNLFPKEKKEKEKENRIIDIIKKQPEIPNVFLFLFWDKDKAQHENGKK